MTVDRNQRYLITAHRDGKVIESATAEGEHLLPGVMADLAMRHACVEIGFRKLPSRRVHKVRHLHLVPPPAPASTVEERMDALLKLVRGES